jgi:Rrf2 family protein
VPVKITTRSRYGLRILLQLAISAKDVPVMLREISRQQGISLKYAHNLFSILRDAGFVIAVRGAHGGFKLARPPEQIRLRELIEAMEGSLDFTECVGDPRICWRAEGCVAREVWLNLSRTMKDFLDGITLADLVKRHQQKHSAPMYYI